MARLERPEATAQDVLSQFATLTLGSGAAAMVLGRADDHPQGHRFVGGVARAGTEHHDLCVGDLDVMRTDTRGPARGRAGPVGGHVGGRQGRVRLGRHGPLHRPPDLAGAHAGPVRGPGHRRQEAAAELPDARQHGPGRGALHPGQGGRVAAARRPGPAAGDRLGPEHLLRRDRSGDLADGGRTRPRAGRDARAWTRAGRAAWRPTTRTAYAARGTSSTTARSRCTGTMLCVHGNPTWSYLWRRFLAEAPAGWRVVAVDQLGMGWSERTAARTLAQRVDDLGSLTDALGITGPVVTVAHDWGGPVSLGWALAHRAQLRGVVLDQHRGAPAGRRRGALADPAGPHAGPARRPSASPRRRSCAPPRRCPGRRCRRRCATRSPRPTPRPPGGRRWATSSPTSRSTRPTRAPRRWTGSPRAWAPSPTCRS